jgi:hypothetical protein
MGVRWHTGGMTIERKLLVSLEEIKGIVLKCTTEGCDSSARFSPDKIDTIPQRCPHSHQWNWQGADLRQQIESPIWSWLQILRRLRDPMNQNCGFKLFLEFEEPKGWESR